MRVAGIIAEYNPFHNGHAAHIRATRDFGADAVIVVMSGNFVQRAEAAILSKWARAQAAVCGGADLVLELPVYWAAGRAQLFAHGGISVLRQCGCVDVLSFGSECADVSLLRQTASAVSDAAVSAQMRPLLDAGQTFAAARAQAVAALYGARTAQALRDPNDTLATEYLLAAAAQGASFEPFAFRRTCAHDAAAQGTERFLSASAIRTRLRAGEECAACPAETAQIWQRELSAGRAPADLRRLEREILLRLRMADSASLRALPDVAEGLENRLLAAAAQCISLDALYDAVKTKRYTHARIRRIVLSYLLGLRVQDMPADVPYLRVLAIGERGEAVLHRMRRTATAPIVSRAADFAALPAAAQHVFEAECRAGEVYALTMPAVQRAGSEYTGRIFRRKTME